jgi:hypothetical protein
MGGPAMVERVAQGIGFDKEIFKFRKGMTVACEDGSRIAGARLDNPTLLKATDSVQVRTSFPDTGIGEELLRAVKWLTRGAERRQCLAELAIQSGVPLHLIFVRIPPNVDLAVISLSLADRWRAARFMGRSRRWNCEDRTMLADTGHGCRPLRRCSTPQRSRTGSG